METLQSLIEGKAAYSEEIQQAARFCLAETTGDKTPEEMYNELAAAAVDRAELNKRLDYLEKNREIRDSVSLLWLEDIVEKRGVRSVEEALEDASNAMPVVESSVIAIAVMYIAYLLVTGGRKKHKIHARLNADGKMELYEDSELWGPMGIFSILQPLFRQTPGRDTGFPPVADGSQ
jgi:hypothetical protein